MGLLKEIEGRVIVEGWCMEPSSGEVILGMIVQVLFLVNEPSLHVNAKLIPKLSSHFRSEHTVLFGPNFLSKCEGAPFRIPKKKKAPTHLKL